MMDIQPQKNSSITKPTSFELGTYTTFAGENNAGKSNVLRAIYENVKRVEGKKKIETAIFIPSDKVSASEETKTSGPSSFRDMVDPILKEIFSQEQEGSDTGAFTEKIQGDLTERMKGVINAVNDFLGETNKKFGVKVEDITYDVVLKSVVKAYAEDLYRGGEEVDLDKIGQGTQRLIIAGLLVYLAQQDTKGDVEYILFEEPEIFLHPKMKKKLYETLLKLSETYKVVISTHDPYFIKLGTEQKIFKVFRNQKKDNSTDVEEINSKVGALGYRSYAEINYFVFGLPTVEYALQLYEKFIKRDKGKEGETIGYAGEEKALVDIRNEIAHVDYLPDEEQLDCFIKGIIKKNNV